jgi:hypothetical protein
MGLHPIGLQQDRVFGPPTGEHCVSQDGAMRADLSERQWLEPEQGQLTGPDQRRFTRRTTRAKRREVDELIADGAPLILYYWGEVNWNSSTAPTRRLSGRPFAPLSRRRNPDAGATSNGPPAVGRTTTDGRSSC